MRNRFSYLRRGVAAWAIAASLALGACSSSGSDEAAPESPQTAPTAVSQAKSGASAEAAGAGPSAESGTESGATPTKAAEPETAEATEEAAEGAATATRRAATLPSRESVTNRAAVSRTAKDGASKGLEAFADFEGKRIGLLHTANVMGEIDPCG